jgi:regulator of sigma E protease
MPNVGYIVLALLGFGFIIFIHELGHFLAAKLFKVRVKAFSLGFPPTVLHREVRGTDYRIGIVPLGGYVSLLGEDPEENSSDPGALPNVRPWRRGVIFLAGVFMNVVSAMAIYMGASFIGIEVVPPVAGGVAKPSPAWAAGVRAGDRVESIDGRKVHSFEDLRWLVILDGLDDPQHKFEVRLQGRAEPLRMASVRSGQGLPVLGIEPPAAPIIDEVEPKSAAEQAGLKEGDRILSIDGRPVEYANQCAEMLKKWPDKPTAIVVERRGEGKAADGPERKTSDVTLTVEPDQVKVPRYGLEPAIRVRKVEPGSPAQEGGLEDGDYIARIGDKDWPRADDLSDAVQASAGQPLAIRVWKDGAYRDLTVTPKMDDVLGFVAMGIHFDASLLALLDEQPVLVRLGRPSAATDAGIPDGSTIVAVDGEKTKTWKRLLEIEDKLKGKPAKIEYRAPGREETETVEVAPRMEHPDSVLDGAAFATEVKERLKATANPLKALDFGLTKVKRIVELQYATLKGMARREVKSSELGGPVRIGVGFYKTAEAGPVTFLTFLAVISVVIAVLTAMPLPPLDGGLVMFLVVEKLIRRPVPLKVRWAVTMFGMVLLLALVAFAFVNDGKWILNQVFY